MSQWKNQLKKQQSSHLSVEEVNIQAERKKHERCVIYFGNENHNNNFYYFDLNYIFPIQSLIVSDCV